MQGKYIIFSLTSLLLLSSNIQANASQRKFEVKLYEDITFSPEIIVTNTLDISEIERLSVIPIIAEDKSRMTSEGYKQNNNSKALTNCTDYWEYGLYPSNARELSSAIPFIKNCNILTALKLAKPAIKSVYPDFQQIQISQLPAKVLQPLTVEDARLIQHYSKEKYSLGKLIAERKISGNLQKEKHRIRVFYQLPDWEQVTMCRDFDEIARADFNNDGTEDFLVSAATHPDIGSYRDYRIGIFLTKSNAMLEWVTIGKY